MNPVDAVTDARGSIDECGICLSRIHEPCVLPCAHRFCTSCVADCKKHGMNDLCPLCRAPLPPDARLFVMECCNLSTQIECLSDGTPSCGRGGSSDTIECESAERALSELRRRKLKYALRALGDATTRRQAALAHNFIAEGLRDVSGDYAGAVRAYRAALSIDPELYSGEVGAGLYVNMGVVLQMANDHAGARDAYDAAIDFDPTNAQAHLNLGYVLEDVFGDVFGAAACYAAAIRVGDAETAELARANLAALSRGARGGEATDRTAPSPHAAAIATEAPRGVCH